MIVGLVCVMRQCVLRTVGASHFHRVIFAHRIHFSEVFLQIGQIVPAELHRILYAGQPDFQGFLIIVSTPPREDKVESACSDCQQNAERAIE